jgi:hypothetical protein
MKLLISKRLLEEARDDVVNSLWHTEKVASIQAENNYYMHAKSEYIWTHVGIQAPDDNTLR